MKLRDLVPDGAAFEARFGELGIMGVTADSRAIAPGSLFVAVPGTRRDGIEFIPQALAAGATAIMAERVPATALPDGVALVTVANARRALALAAARLYPGQPQTIAAVTGTSGKTSVAAFARQIWTRLGKAAASIGTIGLVSPTTQAYGSLTTPDPVGFHRMLDELAKQGVTHLAIEASSHGLDQHRLDGVKVAVGAFTNITRDHLDYHGTPEAYLAAKRILFERIVRAGGAAVIEVDHPHADAMVQAAQQRGIEVFTVGRTGRNLRLGNAAIDGFAQILDIEHAGRSRRIRLPLVGEFQIENVLVAAGIAITSGSDAEGVFAAIETLEGAKGRLELVGRKDGAPIFVDYAHKPDALAKALEALRPYVRNRLIVVFGAGGDRDAGKRPLMGAIAADKADQVIVTDDNPRSEDPAAIRAAILAAAPGGIEIGDRGTAIRQAVEELGAGDVLLIAGKGHESGQIVGERVLPFTDYEAVLAALGGKAG